MPITRIVAMVDSLPQQDEECSPARVAGITSRAVIRLLSDRGVPANEVVVTRAQRRGSGERAAWVVTVLRGTKQGSHAFSSELVGRVLGGGPSAEWYDEVGKLLGSVGVGSAHWKM